MRKVEEEGWCGVVVVEERVEDLEGDDGIGGKK